MNSLSKVCYDRSRELVQMQGFLQIGTNAANAEILSNWDKCGNASGFCAPVTHDASEVSGVVFLLPKVLRVT